MFGNWHKPALGSMVIFLSSVLGAETLEEWGAQQGRKIALPKLISLISGHEVYDWDEELAPVFKQAAEAVLSEARKHPIRAERINEVGNAVELLVLSALSDAGFETGRPSPPSGRKKTAGYPDLYASSKDDYFYVEIKTYSPKTEKSSQRTFYISPSEDFKVSRNGYHLLLALSTEEIEEGVYSLTGFKLLDLYELECTLKLEFNASNKDLYSAESGLIVVEE
jgi:hypothetical protein